VLQARRRAREAKNDVDIAYVIPQQGALAADAEQSLAGLLEVVDPSRVGLQPDRLEHARKDARRRAREAKNDVDIAYVIPQQGALMWFDSFAIPKS
jgi:flavin-binding protein dodecin